MRGKEEQMSENLAARRSSPSLLSVIMPFHNEERTLAGIARQVLSMELPIPMELILVDDGSTDSGPHLVSELIKDERVVYLRLPKRSGKGVAVNQGICASRGNIILIQDADLEYDPREYPRALGQILGANCDFVLGSRVLGAGTWRFHKVAGKPLYSWALNSGSRLLTLIFRTVFRVGLTDPTTMLKVFRRECLDGIEFRSRGFDWDWEIICKFLRRGLVPLEVPISYNGRAPNEGKKLRLWRDGWMALLAILRYRIESPIC
jgi:glycosyltransferase involved in cell wall biosynthesis